jgi:hypothetical protein
MSGTRGLSQQAYNLYVMTDAAKCHELGARIEEAALVKAPGLADRKASLGYVCVHVN